jgi:hypothetical protein
MHHSMAGEIAMKRIAFLTTLIIGASSVAYAQPAPYRHGEYDRHGDYDRRDTNAREAYDRYDRSHWARDFRGRWVMLADRYSANAKRQFINLRGRSGFDRLRIEAARGTPVINQVAIEYTDGNVQKVRLDARLPQGAGQVIRLNRQPIQRIIVYSEPGYGGQYSVFGA